MLGQFCKKSLSIKDPLALNYVLNAFVEWARCTELTNLNFMIPSEDAESSQVFLNFI